MPYAHLTANLAGGFRREELEGRPHLVVPAVMLVEGVLNGSEGPFLYPSEENSKNPGAWDHMPIVVYHPKENGRFVSARQPTFLNTRKVGVVLNTQAPDNGKKLKTEAWFDEERVKEVDVRVYNTILEQKPMEVSTGLGFEAELKEGEFEGTKYKGVARNYQPDHLAVLPDQIGACSVKRGAGLYANAATEPDSRQVVLSRGVEEVLRRIGVDLASNVLSFSQTSRLLADALSAKYGEKGKYWEGHIWEVYPSTVIFSDGKGGRWMIKYTVSDDQVTLDGEAVEIVEDRIWKTKTGKALTLNAAGDLEEVSVPVPPAKETKMAFDKTAHLNGLIGNGFEETDRTWLSALPDEQLQKIQPKTAPAPASPPPAPAPTTNQQTPAPTPPQVTLDQLVANADPATQAMFADMKVAANAERERLIAKVVAYPKNTFPKEALAGMAITNLRAIANMVPDDNALVGNGLLGLDQPIPGVGGAYAGAAGFIPSVSNADIEDPPLPPDMDFKAHRGSRDVA